MKQKTDLDLSVEWFQLLFRKIKLTWIIMRAILTAIIQEFSSLEDQISPRGNFPRLGTTGSSVWVVVCLQAVMRLIWPWRWPCHCSWMWRLWRQYETLWRSLCVGRLNWMFWSTMQRWCWDPAMWLPGTVLTASRSPWQPTTWVWLITYHCQPLLQHFNSKLINWVREWEHVNGLQWKFLPLYVKSDIATSAHHSAALCSTLCSATHVYSKTCSLLRSTGVLARSAPLTSCHNVLC